MLSGRAQIPQAIPIRRPVEESYVMRQETNCRSPLRSRTVQKQRFVRIAIAVVLVLSCHQRAQCQDGLTPQMVELLFGDLSRPADVLLAEADATVAKATLGPRLITYIAIQGHLTELRKFNLDKVVLERGTETDKNTRDAEIEQLERGLKQTESEIRHLSHKLDSSWLLPVQAGIDEQQAAAALKNAQVLVTIGSKSGEVLEPTKLTLTAPGVSPVGFVQISPRVYLAGTVAPGDYQLAWQLTPKSVVQRVTKITIPKHGCVACEVKLEIP